MPNTAALSSIICLVPFILSITFKHVDMLQESQPLIRFRARDHILVTQIRCDCGRTGYCVKCIGRTDDMLIVSGVNVYPSAIRDVVGTLLPGLPERF